ncbi:MAG: SET domain-containing protein-lysine N-methyltransferase [Roseibacillus sp.]|nr:SET domain-containing protein-lysine N-methyltransferase [Roseibacillus sp.]
MTKVNDRSDCFRKSENEHGENATYSRFAFSRGELVYVVCGKPSATRTRESIEIAPEQHVVDDYAVCLNHSFSPNLYLQGRQFFALREIKVGEELTFNYLDTETEIASPFTCFSTGQSVNSEARRTPPESSGKA